jgi:hypothetical protein
MTRKPPTYALANYIGAPYRVFKLWAGDRTTGTEHENRSPRGERVDALTARGLMLLDVLGKEGSLDRTGAGVTGLFKVRAWAANHAIMIESKVWPEEGLKKDRPAKFKHSQDCLQSESEFRSILMKT